MELSAFWRGVLMGAFIPFIGLAVLLTLNDAISAAHINLNGNEFDGFSRRLLAVLAICLNLIPFQFYKKQRGAVETLRGIVFPTVVYVITWTVYYGLGLLGFLQTSS